MEIIQVWTDLVHAAERVRDLRERARRVGRELCESLLGVLELGAQDQLAGATLLGQLPQLSLGHGLPVENGT